MNTTFNSRTAGHRPQSSPDPTTLTNERATVTRVIRPPRQLPGTRAVVGGLLVSIAAVATFVVATGGDEGPGGVYVVANHQLAPGDVIGPDDLSVVALDLPPAQAAVAFTDEQALLGSVVRGTVGADEFVGRANVELPAQIGEGTTLRYRELSFALPRARALNGAVQVGDRVDVLASSATETRVLTEGALVIAVSDGNEDGFSGGEDLVLTLALGDPAAAIAVAHGGANGELSVLRSTRATDHLPPAYRPGATTSATTATTPVSGVSPTTTTGAR